MATPLGRTTTIRADNGPEFTAHTVLDWVAAVGAKNHLYPTRLTVGERLPRFEATA